MRITFISSIILLIILILTSAGCDSPTDSKAITVSAPSLVEPADNSTGISLAPIFKWSGDASKIEIATNTTFENPVYTSEVSGTEFTLPSGVLQGGTVYFWRAGKSVSNSMYWSADAYRFTTQ